MCLRSAQDPDSTLTLFIIYFPFFFSFSSAAQDFSLYLSLSSQHRVTSSWQMWCVCVRVWGILCVLARDCSEGWFILMSAGRVVISEPQAGQQEAAKQLVIWCGLRYCSMGVKLCVSVVVCVSERHVELQVRLLGPANCVQKALGVMDPIVGLMLR